MARNFITDTNFSPLVLIITWFLCIISVLSMVAREATKIIFSRSINIDDYSGLLSLAFSIAQSGAVNVRIANGLGKPLATLAPSQISAYLKATYAADMLYFCSMCLSELSVVLFVSNITPRQGDRRMLLTVGILTVLWAFSGMIVTAAECGSPQPWDYLNGHCIDRVAWWNYVEAMDTLINAALVALPVFFLSQVHMSLVKKTSVCLMFSLRITVCAAAICKLIYWNKIQTSNDLTLSIWPVTICTQTIQSLSITCLCLLYLKPLFEALETGFIRTDELRRKGQTHLEGSYNLSSVGSGKEKKWSGRVWRKSPNDRNNDTTITALQHRDRDAGGWDGGSQTSDAQIIRETRTWAVESSSGNEN